MTYQCQKCKGWLDETEYSHPCAADLSWVNYGQPIFIGGPVKWEDHAKANPTHRSMQANVQHHKAKADPDVAFAADLFALCYTHKQGHPAERKTPTAARAWKHLFKIHKTNPAAYAEAENKVRAIYAQFNAKPARRWNDGNKPTIPQPATQRI